MAVEGILYALPKTVSGEFENRWLTALEEGPPPRGRR